MYRASILAATLAIASFVSASADAAIIQFDLGGIGGEGLLATNELPAVASNGSGGEIGASGITFDDVSNVLNILVGWGSGQGFTDLTGTVNAGHLHQVGTAGDGIGGSGGVIVNFASIPTNPATFPISGSDGLLDVSVNLTDAQETALLAGDTYLNFHTAANGGGEIRGNLLVTAVPEPGSVIALIGLVGGGIARRRFCGKKN